MFVLFSNLSKCLFLCSSVSVWYCTRCSSSQIAHLLSRYFCFCIQGITVRKKYCRSLSLWLVTPVIYFLFHLTLLFSSVIMRLLLSVNASETLHWREQVSKVPVFWFPWEGRWFLLSEACELKSFKQYATVPMQLWTMLSCWVCSSQTQGSLCMLSLYGCYVYKLFSSKYCSSLRPIPTVQTLCAVQSLPFYRGTITWQWQLATWIQNHWAGRQNRSFGCCPLLLTNQKHAFRKWQFSHINLASVHAGKNGLTGVWTEASHAKPGLDKNWQL